MSPEAFCPLRLAMNSDLAGILHDPDDERPGLRVRVEAEAGSEVTESLDHLYSRVSAFSE